MKKTLFWIIYYSVTIVAIILSVIAFPQRINFNSHSLFPLVYIIIAIIIVVLTQINSHRSPVQFVEDNIKTRVRLQISLDHPPLPSPPKAQREVALSASITTMSFCFSIPPLCIFIVFGSNTSKILSFFFLLASFMVMIIVMFYQVHKEITTHNAKCQEHRKKQEEIEESGKHL